MYKKYTYYSIVLLSAVALMISGCAGVVTHYPNSMRKANRLFMSGDYNAAVMAIEKRTERKLDGVCYILEKGTILHTEGAFEESNDVFFLAEARIRKEEDEALISATDAAQQTSSFLLNEKTIPYSGTGVDRVMIHTYLALNYLHMGNLEDAMVEVRQAYQRQREEAEKHQKALQRAEKEAEEKNLDRDVLMMNVCNEYSDQEARTLSVKNAYQNAFTSYLSSVIYEIAGEHNDAYIDLVKTHELRPDFPYAHLDLARLSKVIGHQSDYEKWGARFGEPEQPDKEFGELVIFFQCGQGPVKTEVKIPIPTDLGITFVAFPKYRTIPTPAEALAVKKDGLTLARTALLVDIEGMELRHLRDQLPILVIKAALRATGRMVMAKQLKDKNKTTGIILSSLFSTVVDQSDLRGWTTLPKNIQALRISLPAGTHTLECFVISSGGYPLDTTPIEVTIQPHAISVINTRFLGGRLIVIDKKSQEGQCQ